MPDAGHSFGGMYGLGNATVAWLISRGRGDVAALTAEEIQKPMEPPKCPAEMGIFGHTCDRPMLYRGDYWLCPFDKTRLPVKQFQQPVPKLIDWCDGRGPVTYRGGLETLLDLAAREVDVVYSQDWPGAKATWKYVVRP